MTTLLYAEIKLKADMKDEFLDLVNSPEGFPITKSKPGFISDPEVIRMRQEAGVDTDSQEVVSAVSEYHIFQN